MNPETIVDLRSDTVTRPSPAMMKAMASAELGDDVYRDDPTVNRLEQNMAAITGKPAALFVTSGTQSNLCALLSHLNRGEEYIVGDQYHIYKYEACGSSVLGGLAPRPLPVPANGLLTPEDIVATIKPDDVHFPVTRLLCLENTFNGVPIALDKQNELAATAHQHGLLVHLDGARLFNAATALDVEIRDLCTNVDSVSICLSKGLGAPVGSVLCGSEEFIHRARRNRKMVGGGLRQSGILAACGLVALEQEAPRLAQDHMRCARLAEGLSELAEIEVLPESARTNMIFARPRDRDIQEFRAFLAKRNIKTGDQKPVMRFVLHRDIDDHGVERVLQAARDYYAGHPA